MNKEQYKLELEVLKKKYEKAKNDLAKKYALSNNPYKIGDIVTDHYHSVKIEKIGVYIGISQVPECVFYGKDVNSKGIELKRQTGNPVHQSNIGLLCTE